MMVSVAARWRRWSHNGGARRSIEARPGNGGDDGFLMAWQNGGGDDSGCTHIGSLCR